MMKMAYSSPPGLIPLSTSSVCPKKERSKDFTELTQTESLRCFHKPSNQPNLTKEVYLSAGNVQKTNKSYTNKNFNNTRPPAVSIVPVKLPVDKQEDANLLPSKIEHRKSEIVILPVKEKSCGHGICEDIVCDVVVQQYVNQGRVSPILAVNIEESEINAPVTKHCKNVLCDTLNIDHNRCRRGLIKLYRCDKFQICDICEETLMGRWARFCHKNCTRRVEYRHNNVNKDRLWKERMRELEVQMAEDAKVKKNDYMDPIKGHDLAMEALRNNEELIIIEKKPKPTAKSIIAITAVPSSAQSATTNPTNVNKSIIVKSQTNNFKNVNNVIAIPSHLLATKAPLPNQIKSSTLQQKSCNVTPITVSSVATSQNQFVRFTTPSQTSVKPVTLNNCIVSSSNILTTPIQPKPLLTPIRVVPITNLITAPSLLHRLHGVPKFCIMTDNVITPLTLNPPSLQPISSGNDAATAAAARQERTSKVFIRASKVPISQPKPYNSLTRKSPKKFFCSYCSKYFSTDWYFKKHVTNHEKETHFCSRCNKPFNNKNGIRKRKSCVCVCKNSTVWYKHPEKMILSPNKKDGKLEKHRPLIIRKKLEHNSESRKDSSVDDTNDHTTSVTDANGLCVKRLKSDETSDNSNKEVLSNGIETKFQKTVEPSVDTLVEKREKQSSKDNIINNLRTSELHFVSVPENVDNKNCFDDIVATSR